ncbi:hypothetical protein EG329_004269 [Mollisiaceae sp. DMI_Dod_QoI]|nr:hypothetical protein EG329_004269 [Helotiales sp. DMI_Dod_QoI]
MATIHNFNQPTAVAPRNMHKADKSFSSPLQRIEQIMKEKRLYLMKAYLPNLRSTIMVVEERHKELLKEKEDTILAMQLRVKTIEEDQKHIVELQLKLQGLEEEKTRADGLQLKVKKLEDEKKHMEDERDARMLEQLAWKEKIASLESRLKQADKEAIVRLNRYNNTKATLNHQASQISQLQAEKNRWDIEKNKLEAEVSDGKRKRKEMSTKLMEAAKEFDEVEMPPAKKACSQAEYPDFVEIRSLTPIRNFPSKREV